MIASIATKIMSLGEITWNANYAIFLVDSQFFLHGSVNNKHMRIATDLLVGEEAPLNLSKSLSRASKTDPGNLESPLNPVLELFRIFALVLFLEPRVIPESD